MRDELLALLEPGPHSTEDLADWLNQPRMDVVRELSVMARGGLVKRTGTMKLWALVGYVPPVGRPKDKRKHIRAKIGAEVDERLARIENVVVAPGAPIKPSRTPRRERWHAQRVDELLDIYEPQSGIRLCASFGCGKRFTPLSASDEFCSAICKQLGARPPASVTRTIGGIEYEATSVGAHSISSWPGDSE